MIRDVLVAVAIAGVLDAQGAPSPGPRSNVEYARMAWREVHGYLVESVRGVPDSLLGYRPVPTVRTFAETLDHVAASERGYCQMALGVRPTGGGAGTGARTRSALLAALDSAAVACSEAYGQTEAAAGQLSFGSSRTTRLHVLLTNVSHDNEHYGNIATYLRINGIVPPSSRPSSP